MLGYMVGINGSALMIFYHGIISSLLFWVIGVLAWVKTRSLLVTKLIRFSNFFIGLVFIVLILNIGFPPFIGFISEILMIKRVFVIGCLVGFLRVLGVLLSCYYNIRFFWGFNGVRRNYLFVEIKFLNVFILSL